MSYEISFKKKFEIPATDYINECCRGGDVISNHLLPLVKVRYEMIIDCQEDWGWLIWFSRNNIKLEINIHTDDSEDGLYRIHLMAKKKKWLIFSEYIDHPELKELKDLIYPEIQAWS